MKPSYLILRIAAAAATVTAAVFAVLYFHTDSARSTVTSKKPLAAAAPCGDRIFGHIASLARKGGQYELRFDPAWFTSGVTANTAAAEDGAVPTGEPVPNDNYIVEEGHRVLTYVIPETAHVTVLATGAPPAANGFPEAAISVSELEQIVNGGAHRPLFEPLESGVWIRVRVDRVCSVEQQYRP
jgi:hypothetical protein